jgi:NTE family protein
MKVGIALGSGSARGWAHIGILRALEEIGISPDIVAGSSTGALVGAAYASGNLDKFEQWVLKLDSSGIMRFVDISWTGSGLIEGDKLFDHFQETMQSFNIEELPKTFAAVATELTTGREIWFREGSLGKAVRASLALPGLFTPAMQEDHYYIDGGLVNPVPVSLCRALGADVVIAVNLNGQIVGKHLRKDMHANGNSDETELTFKSDFLNQTIARLGQSLNRNGSLAAMFKPHRRAPGMFEVIASSINIMQDRITRSRMAGDPPDVILAPRLAHLALMDFDKAEAAIQEGRKCVEFSRHALQYHTGLT